MRTWQTDDLELLTECPVCASKNWQVLYNNLEDRVFRSTDGIWKMQQCKSCQSTFLNPRPNQNSIHRAYQNYFLNHNSENQPHRLRLWLKQIIEVCAGIRYNYPSLIKHETWSRIFLYIPWISRKADRLVRNQENRNSQKAVLDVGCGSADFLLLMKTLGWEVSGVEPDPEAQVIAAQNDMFIHQGMLQTAPFKPESFDVITLDHVIEHLHQPALDLAHCASLLKPKGQIWIATPDIDASLRLEFGANWIALDPPRHLTIFNIKSLSQLLLQSGFTNIKIHPQLLVSRFHRMGSTLLSKNLPIPSIKNLHTGFFDLLGILWTDILLILKLKHAYEIVITAEKKS